ncbi:hypothetical protein OC846_005175 [Tilletia horrida]|uniref:Chromatin modification-related protein n=1 Tax=Tilletia horrida TaxID=155126 RepID=A0AAN6GNI9_9BASI|nr:hypothetical protein OC845_005962 [Tilletia horrida]KAK0546668.1 hypothetical protein OC846_005175 [Tilletia horrida]KAK0563940.1 hypothetical protein OC861_004569 [Tilletia horrida]
MSRTRGGRGGSADAGSPNFGLGISMNSPTASTPTNRSPLRRRRSQTDSDYAETPSVSRATSTSRAGSAAGAAAASRSAASPTRNAGSASDAGLAPEPPAKRTRGRPRKNPRPEDEPAGPFSTHDPIKHGAASTSSTTITPSAMISAHAQNSAQTTAQSSSHYSPYDLSSNIIIDEERPIRFNNGKVTASRNARASAAAEVNRRAMAAREAAAAAALAAEAEAKVDDEASFSGALASERPNKATKGGRKRKANKSEARDKGEDRDSSQDEDDAAGAAAEGAQGDGAGPDEVLDEAAQQEREEMFARWHEEYYEIVEQLPLELTRCFTLMRETEGKVQARIERTRKAAQTYYAARKGIQSWTDHYVAKARRKNIHVGQNAPTTANSSPVLSSTNIAEDRSLTSESQISVLQASPGRSAKGKDKARPDVNAPEGKTDVAGEDQTPSIPSDETVTTPSNANGSTTSTSTNNTPSLSSQPFPGAAVTVAGQTGTRTTLPMPMGLTQRLSLLNTIAKSTNEAKKASEEKIELARTACELIDRLIVRLDSDLARHEVGLALGLRKGTEESRGARETLGALTLAQNGGAGEAGPAGGTSATGMTSDAPDSSNVESRQQSLPLSKNGSESGSRANGGKTSDSKGASSGSATQKTATSEEAAPTSSRGTQGNRRRRGSSKPSLMKGSSGASKDGNLAVSKPSAASGSRANSKGASSAAAAAAEQEAEAAKEENVRFCYCDDFSQGEMISCDNETCPREWFHFECVGMPPGLPAQKEAKGEEFTWYCLLCKPNYKGPGHKVPPNAKFKPPPASSRRSGGSSLRS